MSAQDPNPAAAVLTEVGSVAAIDWAAFLGPFHLVLLHTPIGAFAALWVIELCGAFRRGRHTGLRRIVAWFTVASAIAAVVTGWMLGGQGGYGEALGWHKWAAIAFTAVLLVVTAIDSLFGRGGGGMLVLRMVGMLIATALLFATGHIGGTVTHGRNFLTEHAPPWFADTMRRVDAVVLPPIEAREPVVVAGAIGVATAVGTAESGALPDPATTSVHAILQRHCIECHGPDKQKGDLRLDTKDGLLSQVEVGDPAFSELIRRVLLPVGNDDVMPPADDGEPLSEAEVWTLIRWVRDGAPTETIEAAQRALETEREAESKRVDETKQKTGARVLPVRGGAADERRVEFARGDEVPAIESVAALAEIADEIVELSFAGRSVDHAVLDALPVMPSLRRLQLEASGVDDDGVARIVAKAPALEYLNLHSTPVTARCFEALRALGQLRRLVLFDTSVDPDALRAFGVAAPQVAVTGALELPVDIDPTARMRTILAADASKGTIVLLREEAIGTYHVLWSARTSALHDLQLLPNGNVLFQSSWTMLEEWDPARNVRVWSYDAAVQNRGVEDGPVEVHSFQRLDDGTTFLAESGPARILEIDSVGNPLHVIPLRVDDPHPHHDTRLVRRTLAGTYLVAHERDGVVREYARDGNVVWEFEVPLFERERAPGHGPDAHGNQVFSALRIASGSTLITTGNGHRVLEVDPAGDIVWQLQQSDVEGLGLAWLTTVQPLSNGNLIVGNCHAGPLEPQLFEVTRDKQIVWTFRDHQLFGDAMANSQVIE